MITVINILLKQKNTENGEQQKQLFKQDILPHGNIAIDWQIIDMFTFMAYSIKDFFRQLIESIRGNRFR